MTYAFMQDIAASWHDYDRIMATTFDPLPFGLIVHLAGPTDEGIRIIDVWESEQAWQDFAAERLVPIANGGDALPAPRFRDLQSAHIVFGPPRSGSDGRAARKDGGSGASRKQPSTNKGSKHA